MELLGQCTGDGYTVRYITLDVLNLALRGVLRVMTELESVGALMKKVE